ncbi:MAG: Tim44/TimA family putative adaptor protein [Alphaproteobacteria bacterium]|nr:Tim44/TimA family putative adaptor protein [Alphaproteobacteria bacterium]
MNSSIDIVTLISLIVAVVVILKLRSVLGRRTGDEETRIERYRAERAQHEAAAGSDKVVTLPRRKDDVAADYQPDGELTTASAEARIREFAGSNNTVRQGLLEVLRFDPSFDPEKFIAGARTAYEMIVMAFAAGNRKLLKDLLSAEVYEGFVGAISEREARDEQIDQSFVGIDTAEIIESEVREGIASVTVRFASQLISATRDAAGEVIDGDPQRIKEVTDIWTFSRDVSTPRAASNPNWKLVATLATS